MSKRSLHKTEARRLLNRVGILVKRLKDFEKAYTDECVSSQILRSNLKNTDDRLAKAQELCKIENIPSERHSDWIDWLFKLEKALGGSSPSALKGETEK
jgi:hypothetical protein